MIIRTRSFRYRLGLVPFLALALLVLLAPAWPLDAAAPITTLKGTLTITPFSGPPGTDIVITGSGYTPYSTYKLFRDTTLVATDTLDFNGAFTTVYAVPQLPSGAYKFTATAGTGDTTGTAAVFTVTPAITIGSSLGKPGT